MTTIKPPLADWTRPAWCPILAELQHRHGPLLAFRPRYLPNWHGLDDEIAAVITRAEGGLPGRGAEAWIAPMFSPYIVTAMTHLNVILEAADKFDEPRGLVLRSFPNPGACAHGRCGGATVGGSFTAWLNRQARRNDPVGDLARDVAEDRRRSGEQLNGYRAVQARMEYLGAIPPAVDALTAARQEWRSARTAVSA